MAAAVMRLESLVALAAWRSAAGAAAVARGSRREVLQPRPLAELFLQGTMSKEEASAAQSAEEQMADEGPRGWHWQAFDTERLVMLSLFSVGCLTLAALVLGATAMLERGRHAGDSRTATPSREGPPAAATAPRLRQTQWGRVAALVVIGLSPLFLCLSVGNFDRNVLLVMILMHTGCMALEPACYYLGRECSELGSSREAVVFYNFVWRQHKAGACWKALRGFVLGLPIFLVLTIGYFFFRCRTARWLLCINSFERPLEEQGFRHHSMAFRIIASLYFTFVNPFYEEFFWRVFLHRELGLAAGMPVLHDRPEPSSGGIASEEEEPKEDVLEVEEREAVAMASGAYGLLQEDKGGERERWRDLSSRLSDMLPLTGGRWWVRWSVCLMYASYHMWPISVIFQRMRWLYAGGGFCFLALLGRFFLLLRESPHFGLPAAIMVHICVDAAFSVICLWHVG